MEGPGPAISDQRITGDGATIVLMVALGPFAHRYSYFPPTGAVMRVGSEQDLNGYVLRVRF